MKNITFLSTLLATTFLAGNALAETKSCGTNCSYTIDNGNLSISLQDPTRDASIGTGAFNGMTFVTGPLVLPDNVTSIGINAFMDMSNVTSLTLPASLQYLLMVKMDLLRK